MKAIKKAIKAILGHQAFKSSSDMRSSKVMKSKLDECVSSSNTTNALSFNRALAF